MANSKVIRALDNQESSCDVMHVDLFKMLQLSNRNLALHLGFNLQGFNEATNKSYGYLELMVTFRFSDESERRIVKVNFLVEECKSIYNHIIDDEGNFELQNSKHHVIHHKGHLVLLAANLGKEMIFLTTF